MEVDVLRLIALVEARPALYNHYLKEHSNRHILDNLWEEIANKLECSASDCRLKWHNLRSSYARYLRSTKIVRTGISSVKKKKWYLADAMSFIEDYLNKNNKSVAEEDEASEEDDEEVSPESPCFPEPQKLNKNKRKSAVESLVDHTQNFVETGSVEQDCPMIHFFKGLLPDIDNLSAKRQRTFKAEVVKIVNLLADEEEEEYMNLHNSK